MSLRVRRMLWVSFGKGGRKQVRAIFGENLADRRRVQYLAMDRIVCHPRDGVVDKASIGNRPQGTMHEPFLVKTSLERPIADFAEQIEDVLRTEGKPPRLILDGEIGIPRIERSSVGEQPLRREKICLE